ncbi:MAG TPA: DUF4190 domain-containing protein [Vicinamibacteria bacterium]|jgi:hypothetical protein|nr:DUF4190 domain-containing protein [Vicinamibacteria bacterium]
MVGRGASESEAERSHLDGPAVVAFVMGVLSVATSVFVVGIVLGPIAAILGYLSYRRVDSSDGRLRGRGLALAGLVLGIAGLAASILLPVVLLFGATQTRG